MMNLVGKNLVTLKKQEVGSGINIKHLDVSYNQLQKGIQFIPFTNLVTLIVDDNYFQNLHDFPVLKLLQTFSANKNNFADLTDFLNEGFDKFGNMKNLSLLKNPLNPFFQGQQKYKKYRTKVLQRFPKLKTIDGCGVVIVKKQQKQKKEQQDQKYQKISGVVVYDQKCAVDTVRTVKTRSQGNRFLKNNQL